MNNIYSIRFFIYLTFFYFFSNAYSQDFSKQEQKSLDSLNVILENPNEPDTLKVLVYLEIAEYYYLKNPDTAIYICEKARKKSEEINYIEGKSNSYGWLGYLLKQKGDLSRALDYSYKSLEILESKGDTIQMATLYNNIGLMHKKQGDLSLALTYYEKSLNVLIPTGNTRLIGHAYQNIGMIYKKQEDFSTAIEYYQKSLDHLKQVDDKKGMANIYNNIGVILKDQGKIVESIEYHQKSFSLRKEIGDKKGLTGTYTNIGLSLLELGEVSKAKENGLIGLSIAEELGYPESIRASAHLLYSVAKKQKDWETALKMRDLEIKMKDSLMAKEAIKSAAQLQAKYEYEKTKALNDKENEKKMALAAKQKEKQKIIIYSIAGVLILVVIFLIIIFNRLKVTRKQKEIIEKKEKETHLQNIEITHQKHLVEEKNKEILDSITYAKRLQDAILPSTKVVKSFLMDSFILYKPKDIVAGDFYFMDVVEDSDSNRNKKLIYYVAADCTGHGVPGAMVSIVGANGLKRCIQELGLREPGKILDQLSELVAINFSQSEERIRDGMDLALCCLEVVNDQIKRVHYAGANNPLWVINPNRKEIPENVNSFKEGRGFEIKANKQAIGYTENIKPFDTHTVELEPGDTIYTFSDGYSDQFGGESGKKLKSANFRKLLFDIQDKTMGEQFSLLDNRFEEWRGDIEQLDDVCVIGVRL